jgi:hypothetical protein
MTASFFYALIFAGTAFAASLNFNDEHSHFGTSRLCLFKIYPLDENYYPC